MSKANSTMPWPYNSEGEMLLAGFTFAGGGTCPFTGCHAELLLYHRPGEEPVLLDVGTFRLHAETCAVINKFRDREEREAQARDLRRRVLREIDHKLASTGSDE